jgi:oligo-1,6-glucosidase
MLAGIKQRHMRLIIDLVVNHTSPTSTSGSSNRANQDNPYRDLLHLAPGKPIRAPTASIPQQLPSSSPARRGSSTPKTNEYYLHYFAVKQPDLNWDNPKGPQEVYSLMRFWLDKGVDGFRMDVIPLISKPTGLPDLTPEQLKNAVNAYANGPHLRRVPAGDESRVLSKYDDMTVGEASASTLARPATSSTTDRHELNMIFNFDAIRSAAPTSASQLGPWTCLSSRPSTTPRTAHQARLGHVFLSNHDNPRIVSTFGDDSPAMRVPSAKLFETMILTLRGTPFLYQGDELGMTNYPFKSSPTTTTSSQERYKADGGTGKDLRRSVPASAKVPATTPAPPCSGTAPPRPASPPAPTLARRQSQLQADQRGPGRAGIF